MNACSLPLRRHGAPWATAAAFLFASVATPAVAQSNGKPADNAGNAPASGRVGYTVFHRWPTPEHFAGGLLVIAPADATDAKLIALGRALHGEDRAYPKVRFIVYTDTKAAGIALKRMSEQTADEKEYLYAHNVAVYLRNEFNGIEDIEVHPKGIDGPSKRVSLKGK